VNPAGPLSLVAGADYLPGRLEVKSPQDRPRHPLPRAIVYSSPQSNRLFLSPEQSLIPLPRAIVYSSPQSNRPSGTRVKMHARAASGLRGGRHESRQALLPQARGISPTRLCHQPGPAVRSARPGCAISPARLCDQRGPAVRSARPGFGISKALARSPVPGQRRAGIAATLGWRAAAIWGARYSAAGRCEMHPSGRPAEVPGRWPRSRARRTEQHPDVLARRAGPRRGVLGARSWVHAPTLRARPGAGGAARRCARPQRRGVQHTRRAGTGRALGGPWRCPASRRPARGRADPPPHAMTRPALRAEGRRAGAGRMSRKCGG
jgi:hypothetical protein